MNGMANVGRELTSEEAEPQGCASAEGAENE